MDFLTPKTSLQIPKIVGANRSLSVGVYGDFLWYFLYSRWFFFTVGVFLWWVFFTVGVFLRWVFFLRWVGFLFCVNSGSTEKGVEDPLICDR